MDCLAIGFSRSIGGGMIGFTTFFTNTSSSFIGYSTILTTLGACGSGFVSIF
jgi:hypothetical protein